MLFHIPSQQPVVGEWVKEVTSYTYNKLQEFRQRFIHATCDGLLIIQ